MRTIGSSCGGRARSFGHGRFATGIRDFGQDRME
ncbi:hypothetical protein CASFOL_037315 [Castilleja foliolosa]|uniref:Uncharacterized protein n=1 Tax=Castilleja foliolosa TaxID=1961234 RepID=A0ABD3B872_9LAMI